MPTQGTDRPAFTAGEGSRRGTGSRRHRTPHTRWKSLATLSALLMSTGSWRSWLPRLPQTRAGGRRVLSPGGRRERAAGRLQPPAAPRSPGRGRPAPTSGHRPGSGPARRTPPRGGACCLRGAPAGRAQVPGGLRGWGLRCAPFPWGPSSRGWVPSLNF